MNPLRVTFCSYDSADTLGGPFAWLERLFPRLRARGVEPSCLFLLHNGSRGPTVGALESAGFQCEAVAAQATTQDRVRWILDRLAVSPCNVFVPNLVVAAYHAVPWVKSAGIPSVGILHSDDAFYHDLRSGFAWGSARRRVDALVCVSRQLEQSSRTKHGNGGALRHIPYGVDLPDLSGRSVGRELRVAYVGRFAKEQKRITEVANALCRVVATIAGTRATLIGDGPDRDAVESVLAREGAGLPVGTVGALPASEVQGALLHQDALALLSDYEGLPIAVLEAMACGVVPVCTRMRSGIPELVEHNETGLLVDDRGDSFVAAIRRLREEPGLWERLSRNARRRIEEDYSLDVCADRWVALFHELHAEAGPKRPVRVPRFLRLPAPLPGFAHQDPRGPTQAERMRGTLRRIRFHVGKWRRCLTEGSGCKGILRR